MRRSLLLSALCTCAVYVHSSTVSSPHYLDILPHNDLPSVVTWAVMDPRYMAVTMQDLNATLPTAHCDQHLDSTALAPLKRKRRTVTLTANGTALNKTRLRHIFVSHGMLRYMTCYVG
ncbi:uncharacterized protein LOC143037744 [Oratosquilla oratoria]|uniref:uncharacterized protein LOC143037744 n=1 Tax=Oratosquilla oratoria TaxID=337810 RepID=UPI003F75E414